MSPVAGAPQYQNGLGNHFSSEAMPGALPVGRNSPQRPAFGLYAEQLSGTAFTAPRHENQRSWLYRRRPSADHPPFRPYAGATSWLTPPFADRRPEPNRLRWSPLPAPDNPTDFIDGMVTMAGAGDPQTGSGTSISHYAINCPMEQRALVNADAEMLIIPEQGRLHIVTEMGVLEIGPLHVALIPRGVKVKVTPLDGAARGYLCENMGAPFRLPELGPIGANGLASARDFEAPVAAFEADDAPHELFMKYMGSFWSCLLGHSPFDVAAWHGTLAPWRYDLRRFNTINTVSFDHPDPSIFTVLTSPSDTPGTANADFVIFPPRWMVAEDTFRPPWFHRNVMSEYMGLITGQYDAKADGFVPGGASLHNMMSAHGPDLASHRAASEAPLAPHKLEGTMAFMIETRLPLAVTPYAAASAQNDYDACWSGFASTEILP